MGIVVPDPATPTPSASPIGVATPSATPSAAPSATPNPTPTPVPPPAANGYQFLPVLPSVTFDRVVGLEPIPGAPGEAAVIDQHTGDVWRIALDDSTPPRFMGDLSERMIDGPANEEGLLGIAFSPDFQNDRRLYLYYTADVDCPARFERCSRLSRFPVPGEEIDLDGEEILLIVGQPLSIHNAGRLAFGQDGYLYVALGDGGGAGDPNRNGQNLATLLGSILRLDVSGGEGYAVPPDNPFVGTPGARPEIFAYGLRNPWRFSFDRESGQMWAGDVGQARWEEVDRIVAGGNYGWSIVEGFECFREPSCDQTGLTSPRVAYGHDLGCSVTGGYVYRGSSMPELDGWYVYADLCSGRVWAVNTADLSLPVQLADTDLTITSFAELPDGELVALTFQRQIFRLARR